MSNIHKVLISPSQILIIFGIRVSFDKKIRSVKFQAWGNYFYSPLNLGEIARFAIFNQQYLHSWWSDFCKISIKMFRKERPFK